MSYFIILLVKNVWQVIGDSHGQIIDDIYLDLILAALWENVGQWYESMAIFDFIIDIIWCLDNSLEAGHFELHDWVFAESTISDIVIFMSQSDKDAESDAERKHPFVLRRPSWILSARKTIMRARYFALIPVHCRRGWSEK